MGPAHGHATNLSASITSMNSYTSETLLGYNPLPTLSLTASPTAQSSPPQSVPLCHLVPVYRHLRSQPPHNEQPVLSEYVWKGKTRGQSPPPTSPLPHQPLASDGHACGHTLEDAHSRHKVQCDNRFQDVLYLHTGRGHTCTMMRIEKTRPRPSTWPSTTFMGGLSKRLVQSTRAYGHVTKGLDMRRSAYRKPSHVR